MTYKRPDYSGQVLHILNRRVDRRTLYHCPEDYESYRDLMCEAVCKFDLNILEWVLMPNHWHMLVVPETKYHVSNFMQWLSGTHAKRVRIKTDTVGNGCVYQSRYKAFPVKPGTHLHRLRNYLSMNPVKANLVVNPFDWEWGSARRVRSDTPLSVIPISKGPSPHHPNLEDLLTIPIKLTVIQAARLKESIERGVPYGDEGWTELMIEKHGLEYTRAKTGRPKLTAS
ncbi:MAG: transposase [Phycisphaerales bacterium]|jgi:putative transposase|nr:transposase [Phycisphaerales bacterium]